MSIILKYQSYFDFEHIAENVHPLWISLQKHFSQYLSNVHVIIAQKFPHLYNYKRVNEVFECAGSLYPDEVILYPVV